ncbi:MAG: fumarylacetoacetate hydrolase family protein [Deltaproteobacteria bacterium]|nr:fumarylacetoacetate hydrolase family protein [Deltaproteobacteria bacterium]
MKIAQFHENNRIRLGVIQSGGITPLDFEGDMVSFIGSGGVAKPLRGQPLALDRVKLAPPVTRPDKIIGIGLNYKDHAAEQDTPLPDEPRIFAMFPSTLIGPGDPITWDTAVTSQVDYEAELAVIIGKTIKNCPEGEALGAVFGYACANDVSARDIQLQKGQLVRGKALDTFCPLGPWIVTTEEIPDPGALKIRSRLNGELMQDGHTSELIFGVPALIAFLSRSFTLVPGDVILTGTPKGVGVFRNPPVFLKDGDTVAVEIKGLDRLTNPCRSYSL